MQIQHHDLRLRFGDALLGKRSIGDDLRAVPGHVERLGKHVSLVFVILNDECQVFRRKRLCFVHTVLHQK